MSTLAIPAAMRATTRWLVWKLSSDKKVPHNFRTGHAADPTDLAVWATYDEVVAAVDQGYDGIGFALGQDGFEFWSGVDLDDCTQADGTISPEAMAIVQHLQSYTEWSVSGQGLHVIAKGPTGGNYTRRGLEVYGGSRYFTVTGQHLANTPTTVELRAIELRSLIDQEFPEKTPPRTSSSKAAPAEIGSGERNDLLFKEGCRLRQHGHSEPEILALLKAMNAGRCHPPLSEHEVGQIARSASA